MAKQYGLKYILWSLVDDSCLTQQPEQAAILNFLKQQAVCKLISVS